MVFSSKLIIVPNLNLGFKPLKCRHCFRAFGDPSNLNKHIRLHVQHNDHPETTNSASAYKCHICSKVLLKRRDLQRHMQLKHNGPLTNSSVSSVDESSVTLLSPSSSSSSVDETTEWWFVEICFNLKLSPSYKWHTLVTEPDNLKLSLWRQKKKMLKFQRWNMFVLTTRKDL